MSTIHEINEGWQEFALQPNWAQLHKAQTEYDELRARAVALEVENAELKAKLTDKAFLLRGCYARINVLEKAEADCAPYLKEDETPAERIKRALGDADSLMNLYRDVMAERDALKEQMRDVAMLLLDNDRSGIKEWAAGLILDESSGEWSVRTVVTDQQKEIDALKAELETKREEWQRWFVKALNERDARKELEAELECIRALPPVAWRTFDGEGGYDYRTYDMNESYAEDYAKRNPNHAHWVEPLYALRSKTA